MTLFVIVNAVPEFALAQSVYLPPSCNTTAAVHYAAKGADFMHKRNYVDATYAYTSSLRSISKCGAGTVNPAWVYATISNLAASQLNNRNYSNSESLIGEAREYRAQIQTAFLQDSQRKSLLETDQYLKNVEHAVIEAKAAELARQQYRPTYVPSYVPPAANAYGGAPDCDDYTIDEVHRDGKVITMLDGSVFLVSEVDQPTSAIWLTADDIKACTNDGRHFKLIDGNDDVYATKVN
jgi:hypothetical protein